jgi:hypothetical protein
MVIENDIQLDMDDIENYETSIRPILAAYLACREQEESVAWRGTSLSPTYHSLLITRQPPGSQSQFSFQATHHAVAWDYHTFYGSYPPSFPIHYRSSSHIVSPGVRRTRLSRYTWSLTSIVLYT